MAQKNNWTTALIPDLTGRTIIVTGGNSGLGYESVKAFSEKGARTIMACRSLEKGDNARRKILESVPAADIIVMELDLADLKSVRAFATKFKQNHSRIDVLLNNAGIMMSPYNLTKDGFESQIGTNHFGHFALTGLLLDILKKTPKSRVVNVSSMAHKGGVMNFENLMFEKGQGYGPMKAYGQSKLSNLLFTYELQRFFESKKIDCIALAAHPGFSSTNLANSIGNKFLVKTMMPLMNLIAQPANMGALPLIRASVDPAVKSGEFYGPDSKREMKGYPILVESTQASHNPEDAKKLWEVSEKLTSVVFE